jgi:hypothetical protein
MAALLLFVLCGCDEKKAPPAPPAVSSLGAASSSREPCHVDDDCELDWNPGCCYGCGPSEPARSVTKEHALEIEIERKRRCVHYKCLAVDINCASPPSPRTYRARCEAGSCRIEALAPDAAAPPSPSR